MGSAGILSGRSNGTYIAILHQESQTVAMCAKGPAPPSWQVYGRLDGSFASYKVCIS